MIDRTGSQIDHLNIAVPNLDRANAFYEPLLGVLGIEPLLQIPASPVDPAMTGYGWPEKKPFFWLIDNGTVGSNMHLAFTADSRAQVCDFYQAAADQGAQLLHPPALHPEYHEHYYGTFILDPHGINLEAVCHLPEDDS